LNGAALAGALLVGRRRGGLPLVVLVGIVALILMRALRQTLLIGPWNPWVAVLPFLLYLMLAWSVADADVYALPALVVVGSFSAQTYIGFLPLVVLVGVAALALLWLRRKTEPKIRGRSLGWVSLIAAVARVLLWLPAVVQQFTSNPGNLGLIVRYFRDPPDGFVGIADRFGLMGYKLSLPGPWIGGNDTSALGFVSTGGAGVGFVVLAAVLLCGWLAWKRRASATRFACLMFATVWFGVLASARLTGMPGAYQVRWWWVIAALLWCSLLWSLWSRFDNDRIVQPVTTAGAVALLVLRRVAASAPRSAVPRPVVRFSQLRRHWQRHASRPPRARLRRQCRAGPHENVRLVASGRARRYRPSDHRCGRRRPCGLHARERGQTRRALRPTRRVGTRACERARGEHPRHGRSPFRSEARSG
jgi:hypothetical protein